MSDAAADPKGWSIALDRIRAFHAAVLVTTDGDASKLVENDLNATHAYIDRVLSIIAELKKKGMPEAAVAAELQIRKMGDTCPIQRDSANVVPLYRRAGADGVIGPPLAAAPAKK